MNEIQVSVRFNETDALGHVNNTSYFIYLEEARIKFFETLRVGLDAGDWSFILASIKCDFINQAYFNQLLTVKTYVTKIGTKSFELEQEIVCSQTNQLISSSKSVLVNFDFREQKSIILSQTLRENLDNKLVVR